MPIRLALSLHAADEALRSELMPVNDRYPLHAVIAACEAYHARKRRKVFVEYVMLSGVNDSHVQAVQLAELLDPAVYKVNLIPYNPTGSGLEGSTPKAIDAFRAELERRGLRATVRLMGAITQRTSRMRIGHGVVLLPFRNPVTVAEWIAMLDTLSDGRIDVGIGRGLSPLEYEVFGGAIEESRERVDEGLEIMRRCWGQQPFSHQGRFWSFPEIDVFPKPVQQPHPPMWTAAVTPATFSLAP